MRTKKEEHNEQYSAGHSWSPGRVGDQNHIWATRYCQKTGSNWPKFKYLGEYKYNTSYFPGTR